MEEIENNYFLIPSIQRQFTWNEDQIIKLFDSLMQDYYIGTFLLWKPKNKNKISEFLYYKLIKHYHGLKEKESKIVEKVEHDKISVILDGQQRLNSFYIGVCGSITEKLYRKKRHIEKSWKKKHLYLNLDPEKKDDEKKYEFKFEREDRINESEKNPNLVKVKDIFDMSELYEVSKYWDENKIIEEKKKKILDRLYEVLHKNEILYFHTSESNIIDEVVEIFVRTNRGGTQLKAADILLSIATAHWKNSKKKNYSAREEILGFVDSLNDVGNKFDLNKDHLLKSCLILVDLPNIKFSIQNFSVDNVKKIENKWEKIKEAWIMTLELLSSFGYGKENLKKYAPLHHIVYFILKKNIPSNFISSSEFSESRKKIKLWLNASLLKRTFSSGADECHKKNRKIIEENYEIFPLEKFIKEFKGTNNDLTFSEEYIEKLLEDQNNFPLLSVLYSNLISHEYKFHIDHIFPKSFFSSEKKLREKGIPESKLQEYIEKKDVVGNLQLIDGTKNREKSDKDFKEWLEENYPTESQKMLI